jgi:hypothetical protein
VTDQVYIWFARFSIWLYWDSRRLELRWQTGPARVGLSKAVAVQTLPAGRPKNPVIPPPPPGYAPEPAAADRRPIRNLVIEARKFSGLAVDTLVELTKDNYAPSTRFVAATALLDRGYGRPAQSLDLHLSADAITKRLSDMTDAELAALEARMITAAPLVLEATAEVSDDAGDVEDLLPDAPA